MKRLTLLLGFTCLLLAPAQGRGQQMRLTVTGGAATFLGKFLEDTKSGPMIGGALLYEPPSGPGFGAAIDFSTHGRDFAAKDTREFDVFAVLRAFPGGQTSVFLEARIGFTRQWFDAIPVVESAGVQPQAGTTAANPRFSVNGYAIGPALGALIPSRFVDVELAVQGLYHSYGKVINRGPENGVRAVFRGGFSVTVGG